MQISELTKICITEILRAKGDAGIDKPILTKEDIEALINDLVLIKDVRLITIK